MFEDVISGKTFERTGLADLFDHLRPGDTLAVVRLDRLGRSLRELLDVVENLQKREVALLSLEEKLDTSSAAGELVFHVFGALAQFERRLIAERTRDGMNAARAKGGRPRTTSAQSGKARSRPVTGQGRHVAHQGLPANRARTLNALPRNPSAGSCLSP